jgi:hypothetical protein
MQSKPSFSATLLAVLAAEDSDRITLSALITGLHAHARAGLIILFALPNCLPSLPGTSAITGLPLVYLLAQMLRGQPVRLPEFLGRRSLPRAPLLAAITRALPKLIWIERLLHPRLAAVTAPTGLRMIGALGLLLSVLIMLPIPFANILPALSLVLIGLGLLESDGVITLAGVALALLSVVLVIAIYWTLILGALSLI